MTRWIERGPALALSLAACLALFAGCEQKGPAERAGESIDDAARDVQDSLDPRGPAEKTGDAIDDALGN